MILASIVHAIFVFLRKTKDVLQYFDRIICDITF